MLVVMVHVVEVIAMAARELYLYEYEIDICGGGML